MPAAHEEIVETELERVERWRTRELLRVGLAADDAIALAARLPGDDAVALAARFDVDLHQAIELVQRGCPPDLAIRILS